MKKTTILIVDPEENSRLLLKEFLQVVFHESQEFHFLYSSSGYEALNLCNKYSISLILTEIRLKDLDGLELTRKIKKRFPSIPIIIQTALITDDLAASVKDSGADNYLIKPLNFEIFTREVKTVLQYTLLP
jgi:CheY-like chemotaxis protein